MFGKSNLTKYQKEQQKRKEEHEAKVNKLVNEKFFPLLKQVSESIQDATIIVSVLRQVIEQALLNRQTKMKLSELALGDQLKNDNNSQWVKYEKLLNVLNEETISTSYQILDGLIEEIQLRERLTFKDKTLEELMV